MSTHQCTDESAENRRWTIHLIVFADRAAALTKKFDLPFTNEDFARPQVKRFLSPVVD